MAIILLSLNLPPAERVKPENIILVGFLLGPNNSEDLDSFLRPLVEEMKLLLKSFDNVIDGCIEDAENHECKFTLRCTIIFVAADSPAMAKLMANNGTNAYSYCRACEI